MKNLKIAGQKLHNNFKLVVKDEKSGEIIQEAYAENIVLDVLTGYIFDVSSSYTIRGIKRIYVGGGTGTLDPSRTALFDPLAYYDATVLESQLSIPLSSIALKCVIPSDALVGETLTEIGLQINRYNSPTSRYDLITHAFFEDSEGNPISIGPKTDTQIIEIFATAYLDMSNAIHDGYEWEIENCLNMVLTGDDGGSVEKPSGAPKAFPQNVLLTTASRTYNGTLKTLTTVMQRFQNTVGNTIFSGDTLNISTDIMILRLGSFLHLDPYAAGLYTPIQLTDIQVGVGDGSNKIFNFENGYFVPESEVVKVDGITQTRDVDYIANPHGGARQCIGFADIDYPGATERVSVKANGSPILLPSVKGLTRATMSNIEFDFKRELNIGSFAVSGTTSYSISSVQVSNNGVDWTTVTATQALTFSTYGHLYTIPITKARYLKVTFAASESTIVYPFGWGSIEFVNAPANGAVITASWQASRMPKNTNIAYDITTVIQA